MSILNAQCISSENKDDIANVLIILLWFRKRTPNGHQTQNSKCYTMHIMNQDTGGIRL